MSPPTFADWQWSRGIMPWTLVHDWSEYEYLLRQMKQQLQRTMRILAEPMLAAFQTAAVALVEFANALNEGEKS